MTFKDSNNFLALKSQPKYPLETDEILAIKYEREALILDHESIISLFASFHTETHVFFAQEFMSGGDLFSYLSERGRLVESRAIEIISQVISGVMFMHKNYLIYRDLKLENVLLDHNKNVKLSDFGMCRLVLNDTAYTFCGTPEYMAPEVIQVGLHRKLKETQFDEKDYKNDTPEESMERRRSYGTAIDWWATGILMFMMVAGCSPYIGFNDTEGELYKTILSFKNDEEGRRHKKVMFSSLGPSDDSPQTRYVRRQSSSTQDEPAESKFKIVFPPDMSSNCKDLIEQFLFVNSFRRLGGDCKLKKDFNNISMNENLITRHKLFSKVNWNNLQKVPLGFKASLKKNKLTQSNRDTLKKMEFFQAYKNKKCCCPICDESSMAEYKETNKKIIEENGGAMNKYFEKFNYLNDRYWYDVGVLEDRVEGDDDKATRFHPDSEFDSDTFSE